MSAPSPSAPVPRPPSHSERVRELLRSEILTGVLRPGAIVLEPELAQRFEVSKTPVREALQMLMVEGLVAVLPRKGYMVRTLSFQDVREVMELRLILEPPLVAQAARTATAEQLQQLREILDRQFLETAELEDRLTAAAEFHRVAVVASRNTRAAGLLDSLTAEISRLHHLMPVVRDHIFSEEEREAHEAILDAIASGDGAGAEKRMREHLIESNSAMVKAFYEAASLS